MYFPALYLGIVMDIRIAGTIEESIVDGKGIRYVVFTQGCYHNCLGCHNPETHDVNGGKTIDTSQIIDEFKENPLLKGITFSGGEPFLQPEPLILLAKSVHQLGKDVTCYTGFTFEELSNSDKTSLRELLNNIDILIDGKYIQEQRNLELRFRGSNNQRIIDVKKSINEGKVVLDEMN